MQQDISTRELSRLLVTLAGWQSAQWEVGLLSRAWAVQLEKGLKIELEKGLAEQSKQVSNAPCCDRQSHGIHIQMDENALLMTSC